MAIVATLALVACGSEDSSTPTTERGTPPTTAAVESETRTVETEMGPIEIPADPQTIVVLDEYAAMNMLALGVEPAVVVGTYNAEISQRVLTDAGIEVAGGAVADGIDIEAVAADEPDLIVFTDEPAFTVSFDLLSEIAPTVVLPFNQPWRDAIRTTAEVFDRQDQGDRLIGIFEERIDELASAVGDGPSISVLGSISLLFAVSNEAPLSALIDEVGFTRPAAQADGEPFEAYRSVVAISPEVLADHDADLVVIFSGNDYSAEAVRSVPTFRALAAADERAFDVDGSMWFGTFPFAIHWILDDLEALAGDDRANIGTVDDADSRYASFSDLIG